MGIGEAQDGDMKDCDFQWEERVDLQGGRESASSRPNLQTQLAYQWRRTTRVLYVHHLVNQ